MTRGLMLAAAGWLALASPVLAEGEHAPRAPAGRDKALDEE